MRWREQLREFRDYPGTTILVVIWVAVYATSLVYQGHFSFSMGSNVLMGLGGLDIATGHAFGDARAIDFYQHQWWRAVTSAFFHYSFLHIALNLVGLIQLGRLVESWYGTGPFLAISVVIGGLGNLIAGYVRPLMGGDPATHCAGGSTLVMGLVGLCAVVGWRSKTRIGRSLQGQMVFVLVLTAVWGWAIPVVDNYGHTFGAIVGGVVGFFHVPLIKLSSQWIRNAMGVGALALCLACGTLQYRATVKEFATLDGEIQLATLSLQAIIQAQLCYFQEISEHSQANRYYNRGEFIPVPRGSGEPRSNLRSPWKIAIAQALPTLEKASKSLENSPGDPLPARVIELFKAIEHKPATNVGYVSFLEPSNALALRARSILEQAILRRRGR